MNIEDAVLSSKPTAVKNHHFGMRLRESLAKLGVHSHAEQVRSVAEFAGVSTRTAGRYVKGESRPRYLHDHMGGLTAALGVLPGWLFFGGGPRTPDEAEDLACFIKNAMSMSPHYRAKLKRAIFLMKNSSPRTERFIGLLNSGQLSGRDFLDLI